MIKINKGYLSNFKKLVKTVQMEYKIPIKKNNNLKLSSNVFA
jgi:hypothetical protein